MFTKPQKNPHITLTCIPLSASEINLGRFVSNAICMAVKQTVRSSYDASRCVPCCRCSLSKRTKVISFYIFLQFTQTNNNNNNNRILFEVAQLVQSTSIFLLQIKLYRKKKKKLRLYSAYRRRFETHFSNSLTLVPLLLWLIALINPPLCCCVALHCLFVRFVCFGFYDSVVDSATLFTVTLRSVYFYRFLVDI